MQGEEPIEEYINLDDSESKEDSNFIAKIKSFLDGRYFMPILITLAIITAFFFGRISVLENKRIPVRVIYENGGEVKGVNTDNTPQPPSYSKRGEGQINTTLIDSSGQVVGSKNGTKYHFPWCAGAKQISEKNLITFNSIEEARAKGYTPAANCKGLK